MTCLIQRREATAMVNKKCWFWLCLFLPLVPGCLGSQARTYPISGRVTLDGVPLPEFEILFIAEDRSLGAEGGAFRDGKYAFRARAGKKRVEIRASRPDPRKQGPMGVGYEDYIPTRYNSQTTLSVEVTPDGKNEFDFPLHSR
jgi:hypothetical protein